MLLSLGAFHGVDGGSCGFDGERTFTEIDALLLEGFLELVVEVVPHLGLRGALLVDPEAHLVGVLLVVEASREEGLLNEI